VGRALTGTLLLLGLAGCRAYVPDPACWKDAGETLTFPTLVSGQASTLDAGRVNRCDRALEVIRVTLTPLSCEGECPSVTLSRVPEFPVPIPPGSSLELTLQASATGPGRSESLLAVTTGEPDVPENQVWTVVAESAP